ncbi:MAG: secondary thiamine-phosphate synthase enzyme YjbQ [Christensenella sp.]|nr:secondary thiamine-phosphate synthase enzyme YjbQ [Christensenella sp.]
MKRYELETYQKEVMIDITPQIREAAVKSGVEDGILTVHCPHTTAGLFVTENSDPSVREDMLSALQSMIPQGEYHHDNFRAHFKAAVTGNSVSFPIEKGKLKLGTWQAVYFCEFDGPRSRRFYVTVCRCD